MDSDSWETDTSEDDANSPEVDSSRPRLFEQSDSRHGERVRQIAHATLLNVLRQRDLVANRIPSSSQSEIRNTTLDTDKALHLRRRFKFQLYPTHRDCISTPKKLRQASLHSRALQPYQIASQMIPDYFTNRIKFRRRVFSGVFTGDGKYFVTSTQDFFVQIFDGNRVGDPSESTSLKKLFIPDCGWAILDVALAPNSKLGATSSWGSSVHLFNINADKSDNELKSIPLSNEEGVHQGSAIFSLRFNGDSSKLLGGSKYGRLILFDLESGASTVHNADFIHAEDQNAVCFSKMNPNEIFSGGDNGLVTCWDGRLLGSSDSPVGHFAGHAEGITYIDSADDGVTLLTNSKDQTIKLWDTRMFSREETARKIEERVVENGRHFDYRYNFPPQEYGSCVVHAGRGRHFAFPSRLC